MSFFPLETKKITFIAEIFKIQEEPRSSLDNVTKHNTQMKAIEKSFKNKAKRLVYLLASVLALLFVLRNK